MQEISTVKENGVYSTSTNIPITTNMWKELLLNETIFDISSKKMLYYWYFQPNQQSTSKDIMLQYLPKEQRKNTPFNGIVVGLGKRIIKYLNYSFRVVETDGTNSYWQIPFEGWHVDYDYKKPFIWKIRNELLVAIENLNLFQNDEIEKFIFTDKEIASMKEAKRKQIFISQIERNPVNRNNAIKFHGCFCCVCGFDFEKFYGELGKNYIEVHHIVPLNKVAENTPINPKFDLICVCSNCHRMLHRKKGETIEASYLKSIIEKYARA